MVNKNIIFALVFVCLAITLLQGVKATRDICYYNGSVNFCNINIPCDCSTPANYTSYGYCNVTINLNAKFTSWSLTGCNGENSWCNYTDLNQDGSTDFADLILLRLQLIPTANISFLRNVFSDQVSSWYTQNGCYNPVNTTSTLVNNSGMFLNGVKIDDPTKNASLWIADKDSDATYHIDSNYIYDQNATLVFPYAVQPDSIVHTKHDGTLENIYYPSQWNWVPDCNEANPCSSTSGTVYLPSQSIDYGQGSNLYKIGITGPMRANDGEFGISMNGLTGGINIANTTTLNNMGNTSKETFSIWVKFNPTGAAQILYKQTPSYNMNVYISPINEFRADLKLANDTVVFPGSGYFLNSNQWYMLTTIYNGTDILFYVNGNFISNKNYGMNLNKSVGNFIFGYAGGQTQILNGSMSKILIWNRSITSAEASALFTNYTLLPTGPSLTGTFTNTNGLVVNIPFDDYGLTDISGNNNHAYPLNKSWWTIRQITIPFTSYNLVTIGSSEYINMTDPSDLNQFLSVGYAYQWYQEYGFHRVILNILAGIVALAAFGVAVYFTMKHFGGES